MTNTELVLETIEAYNRLADRKVTAGEVMKIAVGMTALALKKAGATKDMIHIIVDDVSSRLSMTLNEILE